MLFKDYHIPMIRSGSKTVTRREWDDNYHGPNAGTVVAAKTEMFKPNDECDCFIRITGKREERLGDITEESARREGDYDGVEDFKQGYEEVYGPGSWDPDKVVTVVEFEYVGESPPDGGDAEGYDVRGYIDSHVPHFHVCNGDRPGGYFLQGPAWQVRECTIDSVTRAIERVGGDDA